MQAMTLNPVASVLASLTLVAVAFAQAPFGPISGDAQSGQQLYYDHGCYGCHGYNGIGRRNLANDVSPIMLNEDVFVIYLRARADQNPLFPTQNMPNYPTSSLSNPDAKDIYAYIRTFKDEPPDVDDIAVLKAILDAAEQRSYTE
jgi:cytochrome c